MYKSDKKQGITLITLVITVFTIIILTSTVISVVINNNPINTITIHTFTNDLSQLEKSAQTYFISNNVMPEINGYSVMNKDEILAIARSSDILLEEITENTDLDAEFYTIDLSKLDISNIAYGKQKKHESDVFVVAYPSMNLYYLHGVVINEKVYYSLSSKLMSYIRINNTSDDLSMTSVVTSGGVKVTRNNGWASKMGVTIETEIKSNEKLYLSVSGGENRLISTTLGKNNFSFNLLSAIVNDQETIKVPALTMTEANYIEQGVKPLNERYVDILKYKNDEVIGRIRINLSNFSLNLPTITTATYTSYSRMNTLKLVLAHSESRIKEIRYEYLTKYTEDGTIDNYYKNISVFDATYMLNKGKKASLGDNLTTMINAPKNVHTLKIAVIDNAGNINSYNHKIAPELYMGYNLDSATKLNLQITANMFSNNGIKSVSFSISEDGLNYTDEKFYLLNTTTNGVTSKQSDVYTHITKDSIYLKMVAVNYDETITETRIEKVNLTGYINFLPPAFDNPIIPEGFEYKEGNWYTGFVIEDNDGNEFVWVPVDGENVRYEKWTTQGVAYNHDRIWDDTLPNGVVSEMDQILHFGGFYVARYESGMGLNNTAVSKKGISPWRTINYYQAKTVAEAMYNTDGIRSGLITGTQWDTLMSWAANSGRDINDSRNWGNYRNSISPANVLGFGNLQVTGFSEFWKFNNIYGLAGNVSEWTNENYHNNFGVFRGGNNKSDGLKEGSSYRDNKGKGYTSSELGFRCVLYNIGF